MRDLPPGPCSACLKDNDAGIFAEHGCGWDEKYRGKGTVARTRGAANIKRGEDMPPEGKTCPWFFRAQPFVGSIYEMIADYEAGRLGPIWDIPAHLVDYLRYASDEFDTHKQYCDKEASRKAGN
jgi:hypothetical protein